LKNTCNKNPKFIRFVFNKSLILYHLYVQNYLQKNNTHLFSNICYHPYSCTVYNIQSILNLAAEDDDGNASSLAKPLELDPLRKVYKEVKLKLEAAKSLHQLETIWLASAESLESIKKELPEKVYSSLVELVKEKRKLFEGDINNG
jgi:hypothetical protein